MLKFNKLKLTCAINWHITVSYLKKRTTTTTTMKSNSAIPPKLWHRALAQAHVLEQGAPAQACILEYGSGTDALQNNKIIANNRNSQEVCAGQFYVILTQAKITWGLGNSIAFIRSTVGKTCRAFSFSWLMGKGLAHCGWGRPWACSLGFYKEEDWASRGEQLSKQSLSMDSAFWNSCLLVLILFVFSDGLQCGSVSQINSFPWCLVIVCHHNNRN